jgi:hypothetical protein
MHGTPSPVGVKENVQNPEPSALDGFEKGSWVRNVWTYQEVANSKQLYIVVESFDNVPVLIVRVPQLLDISSAPLDSFRFRAQYLGHAHWV